MTRVSSISSFWTGRHRTWGVAGLVALAAAGAAHWPVRAAQIVPVPVAVRPCRLQGAVTSSGVAIPGATVTVREGDVVRGVTSTDLAGSYRLALAPGTYSVRVELSAFAAAQHTVTIGPPPSCDATADALLTLASRAPGGALPPVAVAPPPAAAGAGRGGGRGGRGGAGGPGGGANRFQALTVEQSTTGADEAVLAAAIPAEDDPAQRLLPPGFASGTSGDAVTVSGSLVQTDRGQLNDRSDAIGRGEFALGDAAGPTAVAPGIAAAQGAGGGGRGGLGGRGGGAGRLQINATYGLGGSMFDAAPYALRGEAIDKRDYLQQNFSTTLGGPVKLPGLYDGTNRTTFNFSYTASRNGNVFDQYATVPSEALRSGDFSASPVAIVDPLTGVPFAGNQIPANRLSPAAVSLLRYIPLANLSGDTRNFHRQDTTQSTSDSFSLRVTHSLTPPQAGRGRGAGAAGGRGGGAAAGGRAGGAAAAPAGAQVGRGGRGALQPPLNVSMTAALNYRVNDSDRLNVFPDLSGQTEGATWSVPVSVNIRAGRTVHTASASFTRSSSSTNNTFAFARDVAGEAGISGVATDPVDWGVPSLTFGTFTGVRDVSPSRRLDRSWQVSYTVTRPAGTHTWRMGGSYSTQLNRTQSDSNARGSFTFTGLYTAGGATTTRGSGQDFADFLLGLPQQASRQYGVSTDEISSPITIRGRQFNLFLQDDWRWKARWTINYGLQYDFTAPYTETSGRMVNLDATPDFTSVVPVMSGESGPYSGRYASGLINADWNNVAPKVGVAWRASNAGVMRFGYGLAFNSGSYSAIARNLYQQPPFFRTATTVGTLADPLTLANAFAEISASTVTNNFGIEKNYQLGLIHQWNVDYSRSLFSTWNAGVTYIGTRGTSLDTLRAPNRDPGGLRIADVQAFTWQSSEGESYMNGLSLRLQKRQSRGVSGSLAYTIARSRDNTTATGGGVTLAQDDRDLEAEWALSNFDRRHDLSGNLSVELPWGRGRRWLASGGWLAAVAGDWSLSSNVSWQSGTPLTARCSSCAANVAQGVVGTLRANYTGEPIGADTPTIDRFFNTDAFSIPAAGAFGNSARNVIMGPGSRMVSAQFARDVALPGGRSVSLTINANNVLNLVNYASIDTNVNSATFGQVLSVNGRRTVRMNLRFRF